MKSSTPVRIASTCLPALIACLSLAACGPNKGGTEDTAASSGAEVVSSSIESIEISRRPGKTPVPPRGSCVASSEHSVSFVTKRLTGSACVAGRVISVDRPLSDDELASVRAAVAAVKPGTRPDDCPTDLPFTQLRITHGDSEIDTVLVDEMAACRGERQPAITATLDALLTVTQGLAKPAAGEEGAACAGKAGLLCKDGLVCRITDPAGTSDPSGVCEGGAPSTDDN